MKEPRLKGATKRGLLVLFLLVTPWSLNLKTARAVGLGGLRATGQSWSNKPFHAVVIDVIGSDPPGGGPVRLNEVWDFLQRTNWVPEEAVLHLSVMAEIAHIEQREIFRQALEDRVARRQRRNGAGARDARVARQREPGPHGGGSNGHGGSDSGSAPLA